MVDADRVNGILENSYFSETRNGVMTMPNEALARETLSSPDTRLCLGRARGFIAYRPVFV
jgi:hypothetical protein